MIALVKECQNNPATDYKNEWTVKWHLIYFLDISWNLGWLILSVVYPEKDLIVEK